MRLISSVKLVEQKSKFFAYLFETDSLSERDEALSFVRSRERKATHICFGSLVGGVEDFKNDGEVGAPGRALLELLKAKGLDNHTLVVARYFGGVKLGPGGVRRAFKKAGMSCISEYQGP